MYVHLITEARNTRNKLNRTEGGNTIPEPSKILQCPLLTTDRRAGNKNQQDTEDLNDTIYHHDMVDISQTLHPAKKNASFCLSARGLLTQTMYSSHTASKLNLGELISDRSCFLTTVDLNDKLRRVRCLGFPKRMDINSI